MSSGFKVFIVLCLTVAAVWAGYRFLTIRIDLPFGNEPVDQNAKLTVSELPADNPYAAPSAGMTTEDKQAAIDRMREQKRKELVEKIQLGGAKVIDSKIFNDKRQCDANVRFVMAETIKRGIPQTDIAETAPFPDSNGLVIIYRNGDMTYYAGCFAPEFLSWAVYVHFMPNAPAAGAM